MPPESSLHSAGQTVLEKLVGLITRMTTCYIDTQLHFRLAASQPLWRAAMEQRYFGSTKRQVVVIGQGTWYDENQDPASAIAALRLGLDRGMRHIDTAEMYGSGAAEKLVGLAIAGRRDEVFLVS